ncbi:MAG: O-antigen ligase family protein [Candidatus Didemnitutus sp.]|nr:O-antigen ligase family protein [Candidatus Didemnitutus sp.]
MPNASANAPAAESPAVARIADTGEWLLTLGLAVTLAWTTLCLGGYLAGTVLWSARATWGLVAFASLLLVLRPRPLDGRALLPVPFLLFALASVVWIAPAKWLAWREWLLWFQMWLWFVLALHFARSRAQTWTLVGTVLTLALTGVAMAAYQRFVDPKWIMLGRTQAEQFWTRSAGMFGIPNSLACLLEFSLPFGLVVLGARSVSVTAKILCGWLTLVFLFGLVLTGSRGGWIGAAAALALWPVLTSRTVRRGALGAVAVLAIFCGALVTLYFSSPAARQRIEPFLTGELESSRPILWRAAVRLWQEAPWLGTGAASYNVIFDRLRPRGFIDEPDWTHNDYLNTLSDYGAAGFVLWAGAGAAVLILGWRGVRAARRETAGNASLFFFGWRWRLAGWLGLVAFAVHLFVDFHTKIPALAYLAGLVAALVLRKPEGGDSPGVRSRIGSAVLALGLVSVVVWCAWRGERLYRAEALRFDARWEVDHVALGKGRLADAVPFALLNLQEAVKVDPTNGRAWADLSYVQGLSWHVTRGNAVATGRRAAESAARAIALCPLVAESWVHQGVALDMQGRSAEAEPSFDRAIELAPTVARWRFYRAFHFSIDPGRKSEALAELETCLSLDPYFAQAKALRARLSAGRQ